MNKADENVVLMVRSFWRSRAKKTHGICMTFQTQAIWGHRIARDDCPLLKGPVKERRTLNDTLCVNENDIAITQHFVDLSDQPANLRDDTASITQEDGEKVRLLVRKVSIFKEVTAQYCTYVEKCIRCCSFFRLVSKNVLKGHYNFGRM